MRSSWGEGRFKPQPLLHCVTQKAFPSQSTVRAACLPWSSPERHLAPRQWKFIEGTGALGNLLAYVIILMGTEQPGQIWKSLVLQWVCLTVMHALPMFSELLNWALEAPLSCTQRRLQPLSSRSSRPNIPFMSLLNCWNSPYFSICLMN